MTGLCAIPLLALIVTALLVPSFAAAQDSTSQRRDRGVYLTIFRSPSTGLEMRRANLGVHAGFYPTVISREGERENVSFIRAGVTWYINPGGSTFYLSPSLVMSLDKNWEHGALTEVGYRSRISNTLHARIGSAILTTLDGKVRYNPTVGMDIRLGGAR